MTNRYILTVGSARFRLERVHRSDRVLIRELAASGDITEDVAELLRSLPWHVKRRTWWLAVGPPALQRRRVAGFPPVTERQLRTVVNQHVERYFRVVPGGLVADAAWVVDEAGQRIAFLAAAEMAFVTDILAALARYRIRVSRVVASEAEWAGIDLMPLAERHARVRRLGRVMVGAAAVAASLMVTTAAVVAYQLVRTEARVSAEVARTRPGAEAVHRARSEVEAIRRIVETTDSLRGLRGQAIHDLAGLASVMPPDALLGAVTLTSDSVFVVGRAESSGRLVEALRGLSQFDSVRLAPPKPRAGGGPQVPGRPFEITLTRVSP